MQVCHVLRLRGSDESRTKFRDAVQLNNFLKVVEKKLLLESWPSGSFTEFKSYKIFDIIPIT